MFPLELFCKEFVNIRYEDASFPILETSILLQLIYFYFLTLIRGGGRR